MAEIKHLSHTHEAIMEHMVANPEESLESVAKRFGYTQGWLSQLIHSSLFQAQLHYRQDVSFSEAALSVKDRISHMAHQSLKRLNERIEFGSLNNGELIDTAELALKSLGFGAPKQQPVFQQNNQINVNQPVDRTILHEARQLMLKRAPLNLDQDPSDDRSEHSNNYHVPQISEPALDASRGAAGLPRRVPEPSGVAQAGFGAFGEVRKGAPAT